MIEAKITGKVIFPLFLLLMVANPIIGQESDSLTPLTISESNIDNLIDIARLKKDIDIDGAIEIWRQLQDYNKKSKSSYSGITHLLGGELLLSQGKINEGLAQIEAAKIIFEKNNDDKGLAELYYVLTIHYKSIAEYTKALTYAYEGVTINEGIGDHYKLAKIFNQICDILWYQGKWMEGVDYGLKSVALLQDEGPSAALALAYQLLSDTYLQIADFDIALDYSNLAIAMKHAIGMPPIEITGAYNSRANVYKYLEDYDNAIADYTYNLNCAIL
jgi:tetratricopeptide (TPR) repeat protein